jgi:tetratricopeptide (TPR) repeat protein
MAPRRGKSQTKPSPPGETYNLSGDFRNATVNIQSTIVGAAEVRDIETLPPEPGDPPYKGLQYFNERDSAQFFGREQLTARIVNRLASTRFLAIIGASGSGKSSLVRAGVIPALHNGLRLPDGSIPPVNSARWTARILTPTAHPLLALAAALLPEDGPLPAMAQDQAAQELATNPAALALSARRLLAKAGSPTLLLVIDQFEELFTQCRSEDERRAFINALLAAVDPNDDQPVIALILLRADFYASLAQYDPLRNLVSTQQEFIGAMSREELFRAIVQPAALGGWKIQEGLVEVMLDDIGDEPGALPLLSHALLETWNRRRGRTLTLSGYRESGGVRGAIAKTAETVFRQRLSPEQQAIARIIFIHLVDLEDNARDTRRRAAFSELITRSTDPLTIDAVLSILTDARLVTTGTLEPGDIKVVEVAHEALIREWPTLRQWLDENRAGLILHRQLTEDTGDWLRLDRDSGALYRGARLRQALAWAEQNPTMVSLDEQEFLNTSSQVSAAEADRDRQLQRTRILRRFVFPAMGIVTLGILTLLFFLTGLNVRFKTPARMNGVFNIAVAEFGTVDAKGKLVSAPGQVGLTTSGWVANKLHSELSGDPNLLVWHDGEDLRRLNVTIGQVKGDTQNERVATAQAMAARLNAQMIIFGNIDSSTSPAKLVLEFWIAPQAGYAFEDLQGSYQAGSPVEILDPANPGVEAQPEINRQASTLAWLALGLTHMRFGQTSDGLQSFRKAEEFSPDSEAVQFFIGRESLFLSDQDAAHQQALTQDAEQAFRRAAEINPNYPRAYIGLGSVYNAQAQRLVLAVPADASPEKSAALLANAGALVEQACATYASVLKLPPSTKPSGIPIDLTARLSIGKCLRLKGEIQYRSGQVDLGAATLQSAVSALEAILQPLKDAGQERYLAQTYETLGTAYQQMGYLSERKMDWQMSKNQYTQAAQNYDQCIAMGHSSADLIIRQDIAANRCTPYRKAVQDRLDTLSGGS